MFDAIGADRRHQDLIAAARRQYERAVHNGLPTGGSSNADPLAPISTWRGRPALPGYEILREVHRGGQGVVYQATQQSTGRTVAVKVLREGPFAGETERLRFEREVGILAQLNHRNIISILDRGAAAGSHFLVMDYIEGRPLDRDARERGLALKERLLLFAEVCDAVSAAHLRGVIHRDLKPGNILVDAAGEPRILDFGLAKTADTDASSGPGATHTGQFVGSLPWVSPEQARGLHSEVDIRSDVYSLGVILYQLLTDRFPYSTTGDLEQVLANIRTAEPVRPRTLSREIDDDLETLVLKCLAKEPSRRYQSVGELARDVRHYLSHEPIEAKRDSTGYLLRKALQRHRTTVAAAAAFLVLLTMATVSSFWLWRKASSQRDEAVAAQGRASAEAAKATQIARFAQGMLSGIDPATAGDMDKRLMRLVLDGSAKRVESELSAQPGVQAAVRHTIGMAYRAIGEHGASQTQLEKAVEIRRQVLGDEHAETLEAMDDLAMLYNDQAKYADAEQLCRTVMEVRRRVLGADHRETLLSMSNLGEIWVAQGRYGEAETLDREVLEHRARSLGPDHPETLTSMNNLANTLGNLRKFDESKRLYLETIGIEKRVKGELHPHTLRTIGNLALLYQENDRIDDAEALHREVLAMRQRVFGEEHPDTFQSWVNLAIVIRAKGRVDEAEAILRREIEIERRVLGNKHPTLGATLILLASILNQKGNSAQAEKLVRETVAIYEASLPADNWKLLTARLGLGACLSRMGRFEEAERLLLEEQAAIQGKPEVSPDWQESAVRYLVKMYEAWDAAEPGTGKAEKAAEWRSKAPSTQPGSPTRT